MNDLIVWRDKLQELYAMKSIYIDKAVQFVLALVTFLMINQNIGLMKAVATPVVAVALAVICTFLPPVVTAYVAAGLVIVHLFKLSIGVAAAAALIFVVMFIFYCRFTPKKALLLLVTPVAFMLHVPYVVPVACALVLGPISAVPVVFGTIIYYMIECVRTSATAITSADGITRQISLFVKTVFQDKTLWITVIAFIISIFVVYTVRRLSVDHAWKIAAASGAVVNIVVIVIGDIVFDIHTSYNMLIIGNIAAVVIGFIMEFFLFSVDYSRTERLQFEDDEYYYYVKAIPKISVTAPEKTVKHINERKETGEIAGTEPERRQRSKSGQTEKPAVRKTKTASKVKWPKSPAVQRPTRVGGNTDEILLAQSLKEELDIPVFHDDQHGTAIVVSAGLINALKLVGKPFDEANVVINGAGSAGISICKLLLALGIGNVVLVDKNGALCPGEDWMNPAQAAMAEVTNKDKQTGALAEIMKDKDVFIGVSAPNIVTAEMVASMANDPIVFAMANPTPEIMPEEAKKGGVRVMATGRSDYPNQINNVLVFPGIFRGALDAKAKAITEEMKIAAAKAIASIVTDEELNEEYIIPGAFDERVAKVVAKAVSDEAKKLGIVKE